jgi:hypothetical protein
MGRLAKQILSDIAAMERGESAVTESPIGDRGEPRPPAGQPNGRILLRLSRDEHAVLVREAAEQGVSLNHYLTEIVCGRRRLTAVTSRRAKRSPKGSRSHPAPRRRSLRPA